MWSRLTGYSSLQITIVYLDASNAIRIAMLSDGIWQDYPTWLTLFAPANNTKLSASLILEPLIVEGHATNTTHFAASIVYQSTNGSIAMLNLDPLISNNTNYNSAMAPINPNIITTFMDSNADEAPIPSTSLSCIYNGQTTSWFPSQFFTACYIGETVDAWSYNQSDTGEIYGMARMNDCRSHNSVVAVFYN